MRGLLAIMLFQLLGEAIVAVTALPFPGPLLGMVLMLGAIESSAILREDAEPASRLLIGQFGLLFVPAGSAIVALGDVVRADGLAIIAAIVTSTACAIALCGIAAGWENGELGRLWHRVQGRRG